MTLATNYLVARSYVRNPQVFASSISMPSEEANAFQQLASLADLRTLMLAGKHKGRPAPVTQADPSELLRSLDDSDDDANTVHNHQRCRRQLWQDIEHSPPPAHQVKKAKTSRKVKDATKCNKTSTALLLHHKAEKHKKSKQITQDQHHERQVQQFKTPRTTRQGERANNLK